MTSSQARKGSQFERDTVAYFRANGHPHVERHYGAGRPDDVGDIDGIPSWTIECKNHNAMNLAGWCDEAEHERQNGRRRFAAVIFKRRGRPTSDAYVLLDLATFAALLANDDETPPNSTTEPKGNTHAR
jgi:hypothetical protein